MAVNNITRSLFFSVIHTVDMDQDQEVYLNLLRDEVSEVVDHHMGMEKDVVLNIIPKVRFFLICILVKNNNFYNFCVY